MKRVIEDFICEKCGAKVVGDGYTDHCPECLVGKHMDLDTPGDRLSECGGLMDVVGVSYVAGKFKLKYKCRKCRHIFNVREGKKDNRDLLRKYFGEYAENEEYGKVGS